MNRFIPKLLIASVLFFLFCFVTNAQTALLQGIILDANSGEPLIGATARAGGKGSITSYDGSFEMSLAPGEQKIVFSYIGYQSFTETYTLIEGKVLEIKVQLTEQATLLQTATVTSGKYEKPLGEVTVSLDILKPRLIDAVNSTSVSGALQKVPGVTMIDGQANIRGGSGWSYGAGSRVLLLVDDIPALQADAGRPNWSDLPIESIDQIEVVKGAASALYGSSAMNGIINLRTAYAKSKPETKIATFYTTFLDPKDKAKVWYDKQPFDTGLSLSHKQKFDKLDVVFSAFAKARDDYKEDNSSRYGRVTTNLRYRITDRLAVGVNANFNRRKSKSYFYWKDWGSDALLGSENSFSNSKPTRFYIDPFLHYFDDKGNKHKLLSRAYYIDNNNDGGQSNTSQLYYGEYQYQKRVEEADLVLTGGLVGMRSAIQAEIYGDTTYTTSNAAGYVQVDKKLFGKLNLSAGARYERNVINSPEVVLGDTIPDGRSVEAKPVFRLGANYQTGVATFLRASWGQGYRFPTIAEKFVSTVAGAIRVAPNPLLESETGWTAEVGIKQGLKIGNWNGFLDVAAFWSEYDNMMEFTWVPNFLGFQSQNVGSTRITGIDIGIMGEGKINEVTLYVFGGYTYTDPKFQEFDSSGRDLINAADGNQAQANAWNSSANYNVLKYRNRHSAKMDVEGVYKGFSLGLAGNYLSHMEAIDFIFEQTIKGLKEHREADTNGSIRMDARVAYRFNSLVKLSLIAQNIFNEEYTVRPALLEAPTNVTLRADFSF